MTGSIRGRERRMTLKAMPTRYAKKKKKKKRKKKKKKKRERKHRYVKERTFPENTVSFGVRNTRMRTRVHRWGKGSRDSSQQNQHT
jgi:hypothetical protein